MEKFKAGDTDPRVRAHLGGTEDLTQVQGVTFYARHVIDGTLITVTGPPDAEVEDAPTRTLAASLPTSPLPKTGIYRQEWRLDWPGGREATYPSELFEQFEILSRLDPS